MTDTANCLIEIGTEELPPLALESLITVFADQIQQQLQDNGFSFEKITPYATPRRLALIISALSSQQPEQHIERRGPAVVAAFDDAGNPTKACQGFAKSCGCEVADLERVSTDKGEWLVFRCNKPGEKIQSRLPEFIQQALKRLPIPKRMRWGSSSAEFVRPVHWLTLLYGTEVISAEMFGITSGATSYGHRFHHPAAIQLKSADDYVESLQQAYVIVDFCSRRELIRQEVIKLAEENQAAAIIDEKLLTEVTALVEWPVALLGQFDQEFLSVPPEALIMAMKTHQRYFHLVDKQQQLLPQFITISNIESSNPQQVIVGNECVLKARLSDAQFFYQQDLKHTLDTFLEQEKSVVFQAKLGHLYEKSERISTLAKVIANIIDCDAEQASRAGMLCKADLMSDMVGEFPSLQGVMGYYYANHHHETKDIALAIKQHYLPKFAGDELPSNPIGQAVAIADRLDTIVGIIGIGQKPTGVKDPFALRRAAIGVLRIMIECRLPLDLKQMIEQAVAQYPRLSNTEVIDEAYQFIIERLRSWYQDQKISVDIFTAVMASKPTQPLDLDKRIKAVAEFQLLPEAQALAAANKRVSKLLTKQTNGVEVSTIDETLLQSEAEKELAKLLQSKQTEVMPLFEQAEYQQALKSLASLRDSVDRFFDEVMVMVDDEKVRNNRLALLAHLKKLFLHVADISLLQ